MKSQALITGINGNSIFSSGTFYLQQRRAYYLFRVIDVRSDTYSPQE